ncbi:MAG TPA: M23 family metallopeptidase, partial [Candidatus Peribacteraceae bacterium]|nr:M23 family metallopeptidase [Candidatus Peribacteraceae bacterium]
MIGQNGWYLFLASVLGKEDDSLIVYTGTVTPLEKVPDYSRWTSYGGNAEEHTYRQVPQDLLVVLPVYDQSAQLRTEDASTSAGFYSVGNRGSYSTGAENSGSHPGVDIRAPMGSPVRAVANGIVEEVKQGGGFGLVIIIRHPNVPDPDRPNRTTTLYSAYAHLQAALVTVGTVVEKGEHIAYSGQSGYASGPHLHFQIDRESAPFHPYWPFTDAEANEAGLTLAEAVDAGFHTERLKQYTVHPMLYVQSDYLPVPVTPGTTTEVVERPKPVVLNLSQRIALRLQSRKGEQEQEEEVGEAREETPPVLAPAAPEQVVYQSEPEAEEVPAVRMSRSQRAAVDRQKRIEDRVTRARFSSRQVSRTQETVVRREEVATREDVSSVLGGPQPVQNISIQ